MRKSKSDINLVFNLLKIDRSSWNIISIEDQPCSIHVEEFCRLFLEKIRIVYRDNVCEFFEKENFASSETLYRRIVFQYKNKEMYYELTMQTIGETMQECAVFMREISSDEQVNKIKEDFEKDPLTKAYNRAFFHQYVHHFIATNPSKSVALAMIDLDNFKQLNDRFGHSAGDRFLMEFVLGLQEVCKDEVVGRYGGDEFLIFFPDAEDYSALRRKLHEILDRCYENPLNTLHFKVTCSIGVAMYPLHGHDYASLLTLADDALYHVKRKKKNGFYIQGQEENIHENRLNQHLIEKKDVRYPAPYLQVEIRKKRKKEVAEISILATLWAFISLAVCLLTIQVVEKNARLQSKEYLRDLSMQMHINLNAKINAFFHELELASPVFSYVTNADFSSAHQRFLDRTSFDDVLYVLPDLTLEDVNGMEVTTLSFRLEEKKMQSFTYKNELYVGFAQPINIINGKYIGIMGLQSESKRVENVTQFDSSLGAFAHIIERQTGQYIVYNPNNAAIHREESYFTSLQKYATFTEGTVQDYITTLQSGVAGNCSYYVNSSERFSYFTALFEEEDFPDWILIVIVPTKNLSYYSSSLLITVEGIFVALSLLLFVFFALEKHKGFKQMIRENQVRYLDPVTGGINESRFHHEAKLLLKNKVSSYVLVSFNIAQFRLINAEHNREMGDAVLKKLFHICFDALDFEEIVYRLYADEFFMLMKYQTERILEERIQQIVRHFNYLNMTSLMKKSRLKFGVYHVEDRSEEVSGMEEKASYARKTTLDSSFTETDYSISYFNQKIEQSLSHERNVEQSMQNALQKDEFKLYLQPKLQLKDNAIFSCEALVRWIREDGTIVPPDKFIPIFERNGFIVKMDLYMFEKVCAFIQYCIDQNKTPPQISVNLSKVHLYYADFLERYLDIFHRFAFPPHYIIFEITESIAFNQIDLIMEVVRKLHGHGFRVSLDDFGSGYSSLNYLKNMEIDEIKFDKEFFRKTVFQAKKSQDIISTLLSLFQKLKIESVAEGIEEREQADFLRECGCDFIQGYFIAKPMASQEYYKKYVEKQEEVKKK